MNTHQLELFYHVALHGSVSNAADSLRISQPAVSAQLRLFEQTYGIKLLEKSGRGIRITAKGQLVYEMIKPFFSATLGSVERLLKDKDHLRVYGNYLMTQFVLPEVMSQEHFDDGLTPMIVKSMASMEAMVALEEDRCDLVLVSSSEVIFPSQNLVVVELFEDDIVYVTKGNIDEKQDITLITSKSKRNVRTLVGAMLPQVKTYPTLEVDTTQDAIANLRVNHKSASFISSKFLDYYEDEFKYEYVNVKSKFYAIYKTHVLVLDEVKALLSVVEKHLNKEKG